MPKQINCCWNYYKTSWKTFTELERSQLIDDTHSSICTSEELDRSSQNLSSYNWFITLFLLSVHQFMYQYILCL